MQRHLAGTRNQKRRIRPPDPTRARPVPLLTRPVPGRGPFLSVRVCSRPVSVCAPLSASPSPLAHQQVSSPLAALAQSLPACLSPSLAFPLLFNRSHTLPHPCRQFVASPDPVPRNQEPTAEARGWRSCMIVRSLGVLQLVEGVVCCVVVVRGFGCLSGISIYLSIPSISSVEVSSPPCRAACHLENIRGDCCLPACLGAWVGACVHAVSCHSTDLRWNCNCTCLIYCGKGRELIDGPWT